MKKYNVYITMKSGKKYSIGLGDEQHEYDYKEWIDETFQCKTLTIEDSVKKTFITVVVSEIESIEAQEEKK